MSGYTLIELILVLTLMGATGASLAPVAREYRDRSSVVAAREAMVGLLARTRLAAIESGDARLRIELDSAVVRIPERDTVLAAVDFGREFGVTLALSGGREDVELAYDALGLGRVSSQTVRFARGATETAIVVSAYGRVRRR